jgi:23S rRNA (cytosine1962-C5)-methyltransferase
MKSQSKKTNGDYELLDSGEGEKLERFGKVILSRPDPQALWRKNLGESEWKKADATFIRHEAAGEWKYKNDQGKKQLEKWSIDFAGLKFWIKPTAFKHTGIFPEQEANWDWLRSILKNHAGADVLNLFGYTGGASLACAQLGAKVVHIDGSKSAITWARENAELSGLKDKPIRWILEDARVFVKREINRGNKYDGIIMDPPAFGHGANKEIWKIEEDFLILVEDCINLLKDKPLFFLINGYSAGYSSIAYNNILLPLVEKFGGSIEIGELTLEESKSGRLLPCGIFARWRA